jgi:hypothetical protein
VSYAQFNFSYRSGSDPQRVDASTGRYAERALETVRLDRKSPQYLLRSLERLQIMTGIDHVPRNREEALTALEQCWGWLLPIQRETLLEWICEG